MKTLTAVLFAGGESRRMGADKATLIWDGEPLWSRQLRTLRELQPDTILISARAKPVWCPLEIKTVMDEPPSRGPLSGLAAALGQLRTTHLLALAIDLPQMTSTHLKHIWTLSQTGCGVVPLSKNGLEPLCATYPVEATTPAQSMLATKNVSLHNLIHILAGMNQVQFQAIMHSETRLYQNVNAASDYFCSTQNRKGS